MKVPYESSYPLEDILTGRVRCNNGNFAIGSAVAAVLAAAHIVILLAPVALTPFILRAQHRLQPSVRSYPLVVVSMFAFMLASMGEIAQHIFDNWLYIDSRVSTYNFVFYLMTTASNALLATGLGTSQLEIALAVVSCLATPASFLFAILAGHVYMPTAANVPIWIGMFITTMLFVFRASKLELVRGTDKFLFTGVVLVANTFGVIFATLILTTGYQAWHLLTASSFTVGFLTEGIWVLSANPHIKVA